MKITWAGTGSAFAEAGTWQCQAVIHSNSGKHLLIDCGSDSRHSLHQYANLGALDIDGVYVSHLHGDHVHGLEWLAFNRYPFGGFSRAPKPKLWGVNSVLTRLWSHVLRGTLESIEGHVNTFADYFDLHPVDPNESFVWEGITFDPVQTVHVMNGRALTDSFGIMVTDEDGYKVFFTTDTQFCPAQINAFYNQADLIFHDCETTPFKSGVHAHYTDLVNLPSSVKAKTALIHYATNGPHYKLDQAKADGFLGFVQPGTVFSQESALVDLDIESRRR
jgi:ribonuclease BN (tRNA processing enzyme)